MATDPSPPDIGGPTLGLVHPDELETGVNLIIPNLKQMERRIVDLTSQLELLKADVEKRPTAAMYEELKQQLATKASLSGLEQCSLKCEIVTSKLEQKADAVRVRTLEEQQLALSSTMADKTELLALQRQTRFLEERLEGATAETHTLMSKLQAASTVQKDALESLEQHCAQLAEETSAAKVQAARSAQLISKVDGISELCNQLISSIQLKADKVNVESLALQVMEQGVNLAKKADQSDYDRISLLVNGLHEGMLSTIRQKVEKDLLCEHEKLEEVRAKSRSEVQQLVTDMHETLEKRLEEFRSAVASGVFCSGWAESFGQAWLSKVERTETTLDHLQRKFAELAIKCDDEGFKKQLESVSRQLDSKADKAELVEKANKAELVEKANLSDYNKMLLDVANKVDVSRMSEFQVELLKHSQLILESKTEQASVKTALESKPDLEAVKALLQQFEDERPGGVSRELVEDMLTKQASHAEQLRSAELARCLLLNVIDLVGVRFEPDHETFVDMIKGKIAHADTIEIFNSFVGKWSPYEVVPREAMSFRSRAESPSATRVGGGYVYTDGQRQKASMASMMSTSTRPFSASRRAQEAIRFTRSQEAVRSPQTPRAGLRYPS